MLVGKKAVSGILLTLLLVSVFVLAFNIQPVKAEPKTWTVDNDGPADFTRIQDAIYAAYPGDTIYVRNGTYNEHISTIPDLRILGEDRNNTIIDGNGYGPIVTIADGSNVTFAHFTVRNAGWTDWTRDQGIRLYHTRSSHVTDCIVSGSAYGIYEMQWFGIGGENVIEGNMVSDCTEIAIGSSQENAIDDIVADNTITNSSTGIYFNNPYNIQILGNHIFGTESQHNQYGIHLQVGGLNNTIIGNRIEYSDNAIRLDYADSNVVEENAVENCTYGVFVGYESSDNIVAGNNASRSIIGIMIWDNSNNNTVINNEASNNYYGIGVSSSNQNKIYHNNFLGNTYQVLSIGDSANVWDDGYPSGGNYWTDYDGPDLYSGPYQNIIGSDEIGDKPYVIDSSNVDHYPLMGPWLDFEVHDVAVTSVVADRTWVYPGFGANINVTVQNKGDFTENVSVALYYNITANELVGTQSVALSPGENRTIVFVWDTRGVPYCQNYTLTAVAMRGADYYPADNTLDDGRVKVRILGDADGSGKIDMVDMWTVSRAFSSRPNTPRWDPALDTDPNLLIDMRDLWIVAKNFGQTEP